ncbi:hypothetical protein [Fibrella forsythiae]|uniref:Uncharacterized protein n=1 Tax=Fibrella forsythiae TaxID=2817061 RepID=A0ABS3JTV6_9BACT|nr:hypothetical protein [Fibrella forsythiae]MBO0952634.1 hypothetical protein [Fibrella forsythiae]
MKFVKLVLVSLFFVGTPFVTNASTPKTSGVEETTLKENPSSKKQKSSFEAQMKVFYCQLSTVVESVDSQGYAVNELIITTGATCAEAGSKMDIICSVIEYMSGGTQACD